MRTIGILILTLAPFALAQQAAMKTFTSSAEVQGLIANAKKIRKPDQPTVSQPILSLAPYQANLEYRPAVGPAALHQKEAEMFYVISGSGTLTTGGKLVEAKVNGANSTGTAIEGGESRAVAKGDFFVVPQNTPHWFSKINGTLILMSFHLPRE